MDRQIERKIKTWCTKKRDNKKKSVKWNDRILINFEHGEKEGKEYYAKKLKERERKIDIKKERRTSAATKGIKYLEGSENWNRLRQARVEWINNRLGY